MLHQFEAIDYHTAGEPFRIVVAGVPEIGGRSILERRDYAARTKIDEIRRLLCHEPRGHADMYGCFLVPPNDAGADIGLLFWHKDGYSTACGHGTIAIAQWAVDTGLVSRGPQGDATVTVDVPSGRVTAQVTPTRDGRGDVVTFRNVPSYVIARGVSVELADRRLEVDVAYGGAMYCSVAASDVGLNIDVADLDSLVQVGRQIKRQVNALGVAQHPHDPRLSGVYGTILFDDLGDDDNGPIQRNVTVFADGEVDRSPCGSGTCARVALLHTDGRLRRGQTLTHHSIVDTTFTASVAHEVRTAGRRAVVVNVTGQAFRTGNHSYFLDPADRLGAGFVLR